MKDSRATPSLEFGPSGFVLLSEALVDDPASRPQMIAT
jgi:hypothetical protein